MFTDGELSAALKNTDSEAMAQYVRRASPSHLLVLATGSAEVPSGGFKVHPKISFDHTDENCIPSVSTCANDLTLPVNKKNMDEETFIQNMLISLMNGVVFSAV